MSESRRVIKFVPCTKFIVAVYIAEGAVAILLVAAAWQLSVAAP